MKKVTMAYPILIIACFMLVSGCAVKKQSQPENWQQYKENFLTRDGSIVDKSRNRIRHSEGQGFSMLLAAAFQDKQSFDAMWRWTKDNLQVREHDKLFVWKWREQKKHTSDMNNASDGDILIAWSLMRAYDLWGEEQYKKEAEMIIHDIKRLLIMEYGQERILIPGVYGFKKDEGIIVNLSYWIYPAFQYFQKMEPSEQVWPALIESGLNISNHASFGAWQMPPDWLLLNEGYSLPRMFPKQFGLDAVRVPLYMVWAGFYAEPVVQRCHGFWQTFSGLGAYPDELPFDGTNVHLSDGMEGVKAIAALLEKAKAGGSNVTNVSLYGQVKGDTQYYNAALMMLSERAWKEQSIKQSKQ